MAISKLKDKKKKGETSEAGTDRDLELPIQNAKELSAKMVSHTSQDKESNNDPPVPGLDLGMITKLINR